MVKCGGWGQGGGVSWWVGGWGVGRWGVRGVLRLSVYT